MTSGESLGAAGGKRPRFVDRLWSYKRPMSSVAQIQSWSCSLGLVLAFLQDQDQEQDRVFLARPRPRLTVQDLSKNKT
ncbi:jg10801 [Pararge aegeria aegeria]|uniref:Jg10801 protein n=1 Tax=Pararge aegeria aegeria TaxID=348720 RepID=A0A8S4RCQ0_9NEOP|nr:jg10801 [Pararge aegeria aegeria]